MLEKISSDLESDYCIVIATSTVDWKMMKPMMSARFPAARVTPRITLNYCIIGCLVSLSLRLLRTRVAFSWYSRGNLCSHS
jgi:hypothetical protein